MNFDKLLLKRLCDISRLDLSEKEQEIIAKDLNEILQAFSLIKEVNNNKKIMISPNTESALREDEVIETKLVVGGLNKDGFFVGPKLK